LFIVHFWIITHQLSSNDPLYITPSPGVWSPQCKSLLASVLVVFDPLAGVLEL